MRRKISNRYLPWLVPCWMFAMMVVLFASMPAVRRDEVRRVYATRSYYITPTICTTPSTPTEIASRQDEWQHARTEGQKQWIGDLWRAATGQVIEGDNN